MVQCVGDSVELRELLSAHPGLYSGAYRAQVGWVTGGKRYGCGPYGFIDLHWMVRMGN